MTTTEQTAGAEARPPAIGEAGFQPMPHAEDDELKSLEAEAAKAPAKSDTAEEAEQAEQGEPAGAATAPEQQPEQQPAPAKGRGGEPTIPKSRFDEAILRERERGLAAAAYWKGKADAAAELGARAPARGEPELTPQQKVEQIETALVEKAAEFDQGAIGLAEYKRFELDANRQLAVLRQGGSGPAESDPRQDLRLEERTEELVGEFPILEKLTGRHVAALAPLAEAELAFEGVALRGDSRSAYLIRRKIAELAQAKFGDGTTQPQPSGRQTDPTRSDRGDPTKPARDKLALAGRMPPTLNHAGGTTQTQDAFAPERIQSMDLDELATAVPETTLRRLSGQ